MSAGGPEAGRVVLAGGPAVAPARRPAREHGSSAPARVWRDYALPVTLTVLLILLTVVPVAAVLLGSVRPSGMPTMPGWTLSHYVEIWSSPFTYRLIGNTFVFALGSTLVAISIAGVLAWLAERTDCWGRDFFSAALLIPMATPPLLLAVGWVLLASPRIGALPAIWDWATGTSGGFFDIYSMGGMIFIQGLVAVPTSFYLLAPVMRNMDPSFEEAAFMSGASFWQTLRRVSLPFLLPALTSLVTLLMIVGMLTFDVPAIIGMPGQVHVMSSEIFNLMNPAGRLPEYGKSAALNSSLFLLLAGALVVYYRATRQKDRFATIGGKGYRATRFKLGRWRPVAFGFVVLYFTLAVLLPFLALLWVALLPYFSGFRWDIVHQLSPATFVDVLSRPRVWRSAMNAMLVAVSSSIGITILALLVAWTAVRSRLRWVGILDALSMLPIAVPHLMMGVALIFIFFTARFIPIYGTVWIVALGHLIVFLPIASRMMQAAVMQIHRELEEAAATSGATSPQTLRRIVLPLVRPAVVGLFIWMLVHSLREFSVSVMLLSGNNEVLSTVIYSFWESGEPASAAVIAIGMMIVLSGLVAIGNFRGLRTAHS